VIGGTATGDFVVAFWDYTNDALVLAAKLSSGGTVVTGPLKVAGEFGSPEAIVQLSTGQVVLAWTKSEFRWLPVLRYALLDPGTLRVVAGPANFANTGTLTGDGTVSLLADAEGHAVLSWTEYDWYFRPYQIYAVIDSGGRAVVPPTKFLYARGTVRDAFRLVSSDTGYGIAPDLSFAPVSTTQPDAAVASPRLSSAPPQGTAQVVINVANWGLPTADGVVVTAEIDPRLTFKGAVPEPSSTEIAADETGAAPQKVVWNAPDLAYLSAGRIVLSTGVPSATIGSQYPVTVTVTLNGADFNPQNNTSKTRVTVSEMLYTPFVVKGQE
jgi:hypothetical protein